MLVPNLNISVREGLRTYIGKYLSLPAGATINVHLGIFEISKNDMKQLFYEHLDEQMQPETRYTALFFVEGVFPGNPTGVIQTKKSNILGDTLIVHQYEPVWERAWDDEAGDFIWKVTHYHSLAATRSFEYIEYCRVLYDSPEKAMQRSTLKTGTLEFGTPVTGCSYGDVCAAGTYHYFLHTPNFNEGFMNERSAPLRYIEATPDVVEFNVRTNGFNKKLYARGLKVSGYVYIPEDLEKEDITLDWQFVGVSYNHFSYGYRAYPVLSYSNHYCKYDFLDSFRTLPDTSVQLFQEPSGTFDAYITVITDNADFMKYLKIELWKRDVFMGWIADLSFYNGAFDDDVFGNYKKVYTITSVPRTINRLRDYYSLTDFSGSNVSWNIISNFLSANYAVISDPNVTLNESLFQFTYYRPSLALITTEWSKTESFMSHVTVNVVRPNGTKAAILQY